MPDIDRNAPRSATAHVREFFARDLTPLTLYHRMRELSEHRFLFESVAGGEQVARYSFLGAAPAEICRLYGDRLEVEVHGELLVESGDPLDALRSRLSSVRSGPGSLPFSGGWVGYVGYDISRMVEPSGPGPPDPFGLPMAELARYDDVLVFDHARQRIAAVVNEIEGLRSEEQAGRRLDRLSDLVLESGRVRGAVRVPEPSEQSSLTMQTAVSDAEYAAAVQQAQEHIRAGDILQVVLARRWSVEADLDAETLYRAVRLVNPSPYMVLLESPELSLVGASPEMLMRRVGKRIETRPIAGTRPRSADPETDRQLAAELLEDEKERAEHVMLVDLGRNDLGRVARRGTVRLPTFMEIERYSHVMHIVSSVEAELGAEVDGFEAFLACFPAGTVSGAPKIRAMQIIDQLEREARGPYAGAVGYFSFSGDIDTCITIRTLMMHNGTVSVTAGAGIVADSVPEREAQETEDKAAALLAAVRLARSL